MKKEIILACFLILIILLSSIILAQLDTNNEDDTANNGNESGNKSGGLGELKNISGKFNISKTDVLLEKEVKIPESLQIPARVLFGIKEGEEISFRIFIVLIAVWFMLFLVIANILKIMPLFGGGFKSWLGGLVVTCLISITGTTLAVANFFFNLGNIFGILEKYKILGVIAAVVIAIILMIVASKTLKIIRHKIELDSSEQAGVEAGTAVKGLRAFFRNLFGGG